MNKKLKKLLVVVGWAALGAALKALADQFGIALPEGALESLGAALGVGHALPEAGK